MVIGTTQLLREMFMLLFNKSLVGIKDSKLRMKWISKLEENCFTIPVLIHPSSYISPSASVYPGSVVDAKAMVSTNTVIE